MKHGFQINAFEPAVCDVLHIVAELLRAETEDTLRAGDLISIALYHPA